MTQDLEQTITLLERTPQVLHALLQDLPAAWTAQNEGGETWNVFEVMGHLIYGERVNWLPRALLILQAGESRNFEPFDRLGHAAEIQGKSMNALLEEFSKVRAANIEELRGLNLTPTQLLLCGQHPSFGRVTLGQLLATWAVHDLTHLRQISRVMAHQYREAVGPWSEYLGVLRD